MDLEQHKQFRGLVKSAMVTKKWNATRVAKEAHISKTTMTKVMKSEPVAEFTVGKIMKALDIEPVAQAQAREGYPIDVVIARDAIGLMLLDLPESERASALLELFKAIANRPRSGL